MKPVILGFILVLSILFSGACSEVTYPKEKLREAVIKLCEEEYKTLVDVKVVGSTVAIYIPIPNLFGITLGINQAAQEKIQDVLMSASRIALSTDADIEFYCVIAQDERIPEIQLVIIKYVDDIKKVYYQAISRGEYFKRTIIDINENPQAKKEQSIREVFGKMNLEKEMQQSILDDFFRSSPSSLDGIGYWNGRFYVKSITLPEFLAEQIKNRIKLMFGEKEELRKYALKTITGKFTIEGGSKLFLFTFQVEDFLFLDDPKELVTAERMIFENIFKETNDVIYGYKFKDFNFVKFTEKNLSEELLVSEKDIYL
ncbi:MAG: hypothetical protein ABIH57_03370, partial [Candidatus Omnitrophota bacterium]